jgi:two-component system, NtrC family, response regulator
MKKNVLIIDDDMMFSQLLEDLAKSKGYLASKAHTIADGLAFAQQDSFGVVLLDVNLPDGSGLDLLPKLKKLNYNPEVIIITGEGEPDGAELAIQSGAWDYIEKKTSKDNILLPLTRAMSFYKNKSRTKQPVILKRDAIIGNSGKILNCLEMVAQAAESDTKVLISGDTGTGKEIFAQTIHKNSQRAGNSFVVVDCAALPHNLVESVLFGHKRGAFTGANQDHRGLIEQADQGTLMLDEVGELPLDIQKKFLRVLQERRFRPVGDTREVESDFRLISATNRDLQAMVQAGDFRSDLLFRISAVNIHLPKLSEREGDLIEIVRFYVSRFCKNRKISIKGISDEFIEALTHYSWPGNVRELVGVIDAALDTAHNDPMILPIHLPVQIRSKLARDSVNHNQQKKPAVDTGPITPETPVSLPRYKEVLEKTENDYLMKLMEISNGNIAIACEFSGFSKSRLYELLKKHHIKRRY